MLHATKLKYCEIFMNFMNIFSKFLWKMRGLWRTRCCCVWTNPPDWIEWLFVCAGFAGLSLVYGLTLSGVLVFFIQFVCQLTNNIVSVERIRQYMKIESEAPAIVEANRPSLVWPDHGTVELQNLQVCTHNWVWPYSVKYCRQNSIHSSTN